MAHPFIQNKWMLLLLFLASTAAGFTITSDNVTVHEDKDESLFITINEGESVVVKCESSHGSHTWLFPDNDDLKGYNKEEFEGRVKVRAGHDDWEKQLVLTGAKPSDTGLYTCSASEHDSQTVYIYVKGKRFFLPSTVGGFAVGDTFTVPCRASWHPQDEDGPVLLFVNHEIVKEATKIYNPRIGFVITPKIMKEKHKTGVAFECRHKGVEPDSMQFFIQPRTESNVKDFKFSIEESFEWPYVGSPYDLRCVLGSKQQFNSFEHNITSQCPRCGTDAVVTLNVKKSEKEMYHLVNISRVTQQDAGDYTCNWYQETEGELKLIKQITKQVIISENKGQIKVTNRSANDNNISVDAFPVDIFAELRVYPVEQHAYSSKWIRKFIRPPKLDEEIEAIVSDESRAVNTRFNAGVVREEIRMSSAFTNMSGTYELTVNVLNTTRTISYNVRVKKNRMDIKIDVASPDQWIVFDQLYYAVGTNLRIVCLVEALPKGEVMLMTRSLDPDASKNWIPVANTRPIEGTYEKGYSANFTASNDVEFKCEGSRHEGQETKFVTKIIRVSDSEPDILVTHNQHPNATAETEDKNLIYEGDNVKMECVVPKESKWKLEWTAEGDRIRAATVAEVLMPHSRHLVAILRNISATHAGNYSCIVKDDKNQRRILTRTLDVIKTTKPYSTSPNPDEQVSKMDVNYHEEVNYYCTIQGIPKPLYRWYKNGEEMDLKDMGRQLFNHGRQLHISRVDKDDEGSYYCLAYNRAGSLTQRYTIRVTGSPKIFNWWTILMIIAVILTLASLVLVLVCMYLRMRKKTKRQQQSLVALYEQLMRGATNQDLPPLPTSAGVKIPLDLRAAHASYDAKYEIDSANLTFFGVLGRGQFGAVHRAKLTRGVGPVSDPAAYKGPYMNVAVKAPLSGSSPENQASLIGELKILIALDGYSSEGHPNVLGFIGACTKNMKNGEFYVILELAELGDLRTFLRQYQTELKDCFINEVEEVTPGEGDDDYLVPNNQTVHRYAVNENHPSSQTEVQPLVEGGQQNQILTTSEINMFAMQIALGMEYLASVPCIHRDLAARNCLLTKDRTVKIADFGMAKNEENKNYYRMGKKNAFVPYRWMAIESIDSQIFTTETDVWAYGITLYELFTLGGQPYPGVTNDQLHSHLKAGNRNARPQYAHNDTYTKLMLHCWDDNPKQRPSFTDCAQFFCNVLLKHSPETYKNATKAVTEWEKRAGTTQLFRGEGANKRISKEETDSLLQNNVQIRDDALNDDQRVDRVYLKELKS